MADVDRRLDATVGRDDPMRQYQWYWDWDAMTSKDPAYATLWPAYFRDATGRDPLELGLRTPQQALDWQQQQAAVREQAKDVPLGQGSFGRRMGDAGVPQSGNVQAGPDAPASVVDRYTWMADEMRLRRQGRLTMGQWGVEPVDPADREALEHVRMGTRLQR